MTPDPHPHLDPALVPSPQHARLALRLADSGLDVAITSMVHDNSLILHHIPFHGEDVATMRQFEEAVYDNPLLLADFARTDILLDTNRFMVIPPEEADDDKATAILGDLYPDTPFTTVLSPAGAGEAPVIATAANPDIVAFVRRTFGENASLAHRLAPLAHFFGLRNHLGNSGKLHVHLGKDRADIVAYGQGSLLMANSFACSGTDDALYFTLAAARNLSFDPASDRIILSGDPAMRDTLLPMLRKYVSYVMPLIFPSELYRAGRNAIEAPLELVILPLID